MITITDKEMSLSKDQEVNTIQTITMQINKQLMLSWNRKTQVGTMETIDLNETRFSQIIPRLNNHLC